MTIKGDIQHSDLPDELLHEPKGASTALEGQVYVADGVGKGSFKSLDIENVSFDRSYVEALVSPSYTSTISVDGSSLVQVADGELSEVLAYVGIPQDLTNQINKNTKELYLIYLNMVTIFSELKAETITLSNKVNELITKLKTAGIVLEDIE